MVVYEGDPDVRLARVASLEEGAPANVSRLDFGVHSGTHVDAPIHFLADGPASDALPLDAFVGPARVVDATAAEGDLDEESLLRLRIPDRTQRVLLKTRNSELWARSEFSHDFLALTESGARHVVERGIRLLGIDYLSIGDAPAHRVLLRAGVVPLEGLDLRGVDPGDYDLVCLPLRLVGADGAPARAILVRD